MNLNNPFSHRQNDIFAKQEDEVKKELSELRLLANELLLDQRYKKFAGLIEEAEKNTIDLLLAYKESDPYKYKAKVDEFLIELQVYRNIIHSVTDLTNQIENPKLNLVQKFKKDMFGLLNNLR